MRERYTIILPKLHTAKRTSTQTVCLLLMGCIAALILLRDVGGAGISRIVFIGLATLVCLLSDKAGIYCLLAFLTPLAAGISCTYITAIALVILLLKQKRLRMQTLGLFCMICILLLELASAFRGMFSIVEFLRFTGIFLFAFIRMIDLNSDYDDRAILHSYLVGFWVAMSSVLGQMLKVYSLPNILSLGVRFGNTRQILDLSIEGMLVSYNPNGLGFLCLLAALFCLLLYRKDKKMWYLLYFGGTTMLGIMTQSRAFILSYTIGIILYALLSAESIKAAIKALTALVVGAATIIGGSLWLIPDYVANFVQRFQYTDLSNGRNDIMEYYFHEMFQHVDRLLFGVGLQSYQEKYGFLMSAHNATQEVIITWGLIGLLLVVVLLLVVFWNAHIHNPKAKLVQYLPLLIYLVATQSGQGFSDTAGMLRIMVAYSAILLPLKGGKPHSTASNKH